MTRENLKTLSYSLHNKVVSKCIGNFIGTFTYKCVNLKIFVMIFITHCNHLIRNIIKLMFKMSRNVLIYVIIYYIRIGNN